MSHCLPDQIHQFIKVSDIDKTVTPATDGMVPRPIPGALVVCALCGETREILSNGDVKIVADPKLI